MPVLLASGVSESTQRFFAAFVVVWVIGGILLYPFRRIIGGNQATGGGPGGSEKNIVGVTWFLLALAVGIYLAAGSPSAAVG